MLCGGSTKITLSRSVTFQYFDFYFEKISSFQQLSSSFTRSPEDQARPGDDALLQMCELIVPPKSVGTPPTCDYVEFPNKEMLNVDVKR